MAARKPHKPIHNLGAFAHPPKAGTKAKAPVNKAAARTHLDKPSKPETAKVVKGPSKMKANTTAPAKARAVTAGPNGSFPIGDAKHARMAIGGATRSERAGNISAATAASIKSKARAKLKKGNNS